MIILTESNFSNIITEVSADKKKLFLKGVFMEAENKNRNGRIYQRNEVERAVEKFNNAAQEGRHVLGALDHPPNLEIRLEDVSHKIVEMYMDGNNAIGKAELLPTPNGQIAKSLLEAGIKLGVSSRGTGVVNENTGVVENFDCVTVDIVAQPSAINAYPESVLEHLNYYQRRQHIMDLAAAVKNDKKAQMYFEKEINKFINDLFKK